jgi:hypothetical protein
MLGRSSPREPQQHAEDSRPLLPQSEAIFSAEGDDDDYEDHEESALHDQRPIPAERTVSLPLRSTMQSRETGTSGYEWGNILTYAFATLRV